MKKLLIILSLFISTNAFAKDYSLQDVESYLSNLKNLQVSFDQIVPGEDFSKGELYIRKPGKFLWQYTSPNKAKIVSNGGFVYFIDDETGQATQIPNTGILFTLLSQADVDFNSKTISLDSLSQNKTRVIVNLVAKVDDMQVPLRLIFKKLIKEEKIELIKIISKNQLDQAVIVSLYNHDTSGKFSSSIFKIEVEDDQI